MADFTQIETGVTATPLMPRQGVSQDIFLPRVHSRPPAPRTILRPALGADRWWQACGAFIAVRLRRLVAEPLSPYARLCELGCGTGRRLEFLAQELPELEAFHGLDRDAGCIERDRGRMVDTRISFHTVGAHGWLVDAPRGGTLYLSVAGEFEFTPRRDLVDFFSVLASQGAPAGIVLLEPVPADFIPPHKSNCLPSLGHDYAALLLDAGFQLRCQRTLRVDNTLLLYLIAEHRP